MQAKQVEQEKEGGHDNIRPATHRLGQYQSQENHQDWRQHQNRERQPNELVETPVGHRFYHVAAVDVQDIAQKIN
jgi:hypothetical protein